MGISMISKAGLADDALSFLGYPSVRYMNPDSGVSPYGFDCSGFLVFLLKRLGFPLSQGIRHVNEFFDNFGVFIHAECASRGDLVFFSRDGSSPRHLGIMISKDTYIHAPGKNNSVIKLAILKTKKIHPQSEHQIYFHNPIGFKRLAIKNSRYQHMLQ